MLDRGAHVTRVGQRAHERQGDASAQGFGCGGATPPLNGHRHVTGRFGRVRETSNRIEVYALQPAAFTRGPLVELGGRLDEHTVEKRASVHRECRRVVGPRNGIVEVVNIARHHGRIERECRRSGNGILISEIAPERVHPLLQRVTRPLVIALRPQQREQLVARYTRRAGSGEHGEEREAAAL